MKKVFSLIAIMFVCLLIVGCGDKESNTDDNNSNNKQQNSSSYNLVDFKKDVKKLVPTITEEEVYYQMVGAIDGCKIYDEEGGNNRIEVYKFDKSSDEYKQAEKTQKLSLSGTMEFEALVKNGYALLIDDEFPQKAEIITLFNKLK